MEPWILFCMGMLQTDESYGSKKKHLPQLDIWDQSISLDSSLLLRSGNGIFLIQYHKHRSLERCDYSYVNRALAPDL